MTTKSKKSTSKKKEVKVFDLPQPVFNSMINLQQKVQSSQQHYQRSVAEAETHCTTVAFLVGLEKPEEWTFEIDPKAKTLKATKR